MLSYQFSFFLYPFSSSSFLSLSLSLSIFLTIPDITQRHCVISGIERKIESDYLLINRWNNYKTRTQCRRTGSSARKGYKYNKCKLIFNTLLQDKQNQVNKNIIIKSVPWDLVIFYLRLKLIIFGLNSDGEKNYLYDL